MRKTIAIAFALLSAGTFAGQAFASQLPIRTFDPLSEFRSECYVEGGGFGFLGKRAVCQFKDGTIVKFHSRDGFGLYFGSGLFGKPIFEKKPCPIKVAPLLSEESGGKLKDKGHCEIYPVKEPIGKPIEGMPMQPSQPILRGLYQGY